MCPAGGIRRKKGICLEKKKEIDIDSILSKLKEEKSRGEIDQKPLSEFRNNQKHFQYDYEEDFYEPHKSSYSYDDY
jgi:hypothetical protein